MSWTTRAIGESSYKYISAKSEQEAMNHKSLLYGEDLALNSIVVVEGPLDAWRLGPGAVATLGVNVTAAQILRISQYPFRSICFDSEPSAQRRARKLANQLSIFPGKTSIIQLDAPDPGEACPKEVKRLRKAVFAEV